jgi:hypothetical protein
LKVGKLQRLFKKAILALLVTLLPAESSLTLPAPLTLAGGSGVEIGFFFSFLWVLNDALRSEVQDVREIEQTYFEGAAGIGGSVLVDELVFLACLAGRELSANSCWSNCFLFFSSSFEGFDGSDNLDDFDCFDGFVTATVLRRSLSSLLTTFLEPLLLVLTHLARTSVVRSCSGSLFLGLVFFDQLDSLLVFANAKLSIWLLPHFFLVPMLFSATSCGTLK